MPPRSGGSARLPSDRRSRAGVGRKGSRSWRGGPPRSGESMPPACRTTFSASWGAGAAKAGTAPERSGRGRTSSRLLLLVAGGASGDAGVFHGELDELFELRIRLSATDEVALFAI